MQPCGQSKNAVYAEGAWLDIQLLISGALLGGSQGLVAAAKVRPEIGPDTARLRVNRLLNMTGTRGRAAGNALGVLGLLFAGIESGLGYLNDGSIPDSAATVAAGIGCSSKSIATCQVVPALACKQFSCPAGFGTGSLFRSARGPRAAAVAGAVGALAASGLVAARHTVSQNL